MSHAIVEIERADTEKRFSNIFNAFSIRGVVFPNRLFFAPMGIDLADHDGSFSEGLREFYSGIADGGCGFLFLSNATVSRDSILQTRGLRLYDAAHVEKLASFIAECEAKGVLVGVQLQHYGGQAITTFVRGKALLTPSGVPTPMFKLRDPRYRVRPMEEADFAEVQQQFANSARLARQAGARLVQLQASNGYLLSSFLSPRTNLRTDRYGGDPIGRATFLREVIAAVRREIGDEIVLGVRLGVDDCFGPEGSCPEHFEHVVPLLEEAGTDMFEVSICIAETFKLLSERPDTMGAYFEKQVRTIKSYAKVPVSFAGFVGSLDKAESLISEGSADMVGMARALFADNDLITKTLQGREAEIHKCLWDGKCFKDKANPKYDRVYCCVNPKYKRPE